MENESVYERPVTLKNIFKFAVHGINKKTLMWYDEIGLFHPAAIHPENGYRYYNYHQSPVKACNIEKYFQICRSDDCDDGFYVILHNG